MSDQRFRHRPLLDAGHCVPQYVRNMSDLYLELRSKIPIVAAQTRIGAERIREAQDLVGLSNESIARRIPVSEKTWRRWKEKGEIPTASLPAVAKALRLELHALQPDETVGAYDLSRRTHSIQDRLDQIERRQADAFVLLQELAGTLDEVLTSVQSLVAAQAAAPAGKAAGRARAGH